MNNQLRERLLGYLLDALEDDERRDVEQLLEDDPSLLDELQRLRASLEPLAEDADDFEPPPGLAQRACSRVARQRDREPSPLPGGCPPTVARGAASRARISVADVVVTAGIVLASVLMFFPAIASSRYASRLTHCQNNLRQLGLALVNYSDKLGCGFFPAVPSEGNRSFAGIYAPTLIDTGYLEDTSTLICPASALAEQRAANHAPLVYHVASLGEIDRATPQAIVPIQQRAGGSYGYTLGVIAEGTHVAPRNQGRPRFALMADAPKDPGGESGSSNHAGRGLNFLYEDGHYQFVPVSAQDAPWLDNPFRNRHGMVEAGVDEDDAVIAPSATPPFIRAISSRPAH